MKISIITPSLNQAQYLEQTIDSVLSQNYPNLEYIIIDGGSIDGSVDIIKKYEEHLAYWVSESDSGQSEAINKGIAKATGNVINWLNSDDYYEPDALEIVASYFENPSTSALCTRANHVNNKGLVEVSNGTDVYKNNLAKTIGWARMDQPETFFRREAWEKVGPLNNQLHYLMDREWWIRYLFEFGLEGIVKTNDILVNFRLHYTSKTVSMSPKFQEDHDAIFNFIATKFGFLEIAECIRAHCIINQDYCFFEINPIHTELVEASLNYYLLHRAHEFYYQGNKERTNAFLALISKHLFKGDEKRLYSKLFFRNRFIPQRIIHKLRG